MKRLLPPGKERCKKEKSKEKKRTKEKEIQVLSLAVVGGSVLSYSIFLLRGNPAGPVNHTTRSPSPGES